MREERENGGGGRRIDLASPLLYLPSLLSFHLPSARLTSSRKREREERKPPFSFRRQRPTLYNAPYILLPLPTTLTS